VTVVARVSGVANPVGVYRMGDSPTAGDSYILRIRLEHATAASSVTSDVAQVGQTVQVFIKEGNGPEEQITTMLISEIGILAKVNLCRSDSVLNLADAAELAACPSISPNSHCPCADVNGDGQVDMRDWAMLQNEFAGG
jgi:Dockerin type I domain